MNKMYLGPKMSNLSCRPLLEWTLKYMYLTKSHPTQNTTETPHYQENIIQTAQHST